MACEGILGNSAKSDAVGTHEGQDAKKEGFVNGNLSPRKNSEEFFTPDNLSAGEEEEGDDEFVPATEDFTKDEGNEFIPATEDFTKDDAQVLTELKKDLLSTDIDHFGVSFTDLMEEIHILNFKERIFEANELIANIEKAIQYHKENKTFVVTDSSSKGSDKNAQERFEEFCRLYEAEEIHDRIKTRVKYLNKVRKDLLTDEGWTVKVEDEKKRMRVLYKKIEGSPNHCVRADGYIKASVGDIIAVLNEVDLYHKFVPYFKFPFRLGLKQMNRVVQLAKVDQVLHAEVDCPWPFTDRDAVVNVFAGDDLLASRSILIGVQSVRGKKMVKECKIPEDLIHDELDEEDDDGECENEEEGDAKGESRGSAGKKESVSSKRRDSKTSIASTASKKSGKAKKEKKKKKSSKSNKIVRVGVQGGIILEVVTLEETYCRMNWEVDPKIDHIPAWLLNFITQKAVQMGFDRFHEACRSVPGSEWADRVNENRELYGMIEDRRKEMEDFFGAENLENLASINNQK
eukprot:Nk52_evm16s279 gene=Nk52_evmTU16s279